MALNEVTENEMMVAGMSLLGTGIMPSDVNVFAASNYLEHFKATGREVESLQLSSGVADIAREIVLLAEMKEKDEQKNDSLDSAISLMTTAQQDALERIRDGHMSVSYNNGIFTINGVDIEEEALEKTLKNVDENFDAFAAKHGLEGAEAAQFHMLVQAFNQTDDPDLRMQYLQDMAKINPDATHDIVKNAKNDTELAFDRSDVNASQNAESVAKDLTNGNASVDSIVSSNSSADTNRVVAQVDNMELRSSVVSAKGYASAQADDLAASDVSNIDSIGDLFGDVASGETVSIANNDVVNTQSVPTNAPAIAI